MAKETGPGKTNLHRLYFRYVLTVIAGALIFVSCEDDYESDADDKAIPLTYQEQSIKAPGHGQYKLGILSGDEVEIKVDLSSISGLQTLSITKTVNLAVDQTFGTNGVLTVDASAIDSEYIFSYTPPETDVDQLVGFTFKAAGAGTHLESDLQLVVTLSPRDNLPRRKWMWKSKIWVDNDNAQDIKECEKDNYYLFNGDGTMSLNYGANTGSSGCDFDGFNVYDTWSLSEDESEFTMVYHSIFSPDVFQTEKYRVKTLTTEKLELEIDYDLSWAGLGTEETFLYEFNAAPK